MKNFTNILMALTKGDSPLLWRGARGEAKSVNILCVNIPNDNTKNINTLTIEIVGFDKKRVHPFAKKIDLIQLSPPSTHSSFVTSHLSFIAPIPKNAPFIPNFCNDLLQFVTFVASLKKQIIYR